MNSDSGNPISVSRTRLMNSVSLMSSVSLMVGVCLMHQKTPNHRILWK